MAEAEAELARVDERMGDGANPAPPTVHVRQRRVSPAEWLLQAFCSICPVPDTFLRELHGSPAHSACAPESSLCLCAGFTQRWFLLNIVLATARGPTGIQEDIRCLLHCKTLVWCHCSIKDFLVKSCRL